MAVSFQYSALEAWGEGDTRKRLGEAARLNEVGLLWLPAFDLNKNYVDYK